jgi:ankyrin repeat protein
MLTAGWPVDARGECDMTPLQWASWHGNAEMVREILKYLELELSCMYETTALGSMQVC